MAASIMVRYTHENAGHESGILSKAPITKPRETGERETHTQEKLSNRRDFGRETREAEQQKRETFRERDVSGERRKLSNRRERRFGRERHKKLSNRRQTSDRIA